MLQILIPLSSFSSVHDFQPTIITAQSSGTFRFARSSGSSPITSGGLVLGGSTSACSLFPNQKGAFAHRGSQVPKCNCSGPAISHGIIQICNGLSSLGSLSGFCGQLMCTYMSLFFQCASFSCFAVGPRDFQLVGFPFWLVHGTAGFHQSLGSLLAARLSGHTTLVVGNLDNIFEGAFRTTASDCGCNHPDLGS